MATKNVIKKIIKNGVEYEIYASGGATVDIDSELSATSTNPVQNKKIKEELDKKANSSSLGTAASKDTGTASGNVPILDSNGKLSTAVLPGLALTDTFTVTNQSDLTTLSSAEKGDVGIVTSERKSYILSQAPYSTLSNWKELLTPADAVTSVNGQTGAITGLATTRDVLTKTNTTSYTPTANYHPATKKYVDDMVGNIETLLAAL